MAANVDSPKRRSLHVQDGRGAAGNESVLSSAETSRNVKRLSAEKRKDKEGKKRSSDRIKRKQDPANGPPNEENESDQTPSDTAPPTGRKEKRDTDSSVHSMALRNANNAAPIQPNTQSGDPLHTPSAGHSKNSSGGKIKDSPRGAASSNQIETSFSRATRSSRAKNHEEPEASNVGRGVEKKDKAEVSFGKEPGPGAISSLRARRSRDGTNITGENNPRGAANTSLRKETRSRGNNPEESGAITGIGGSGEDSKSSKEEIKNKHLAEPNSQKGSEDPGGSNRSLRSRRSREGSSVNIKNSPKVAVMDTSVSRRTRASKGKDVEEAGISATVRGQEGEGLDKTRNDNPILAASGSEKVEALGGRNRRKNDSSPNDGPKESAGTNISISQEIRSSRAGKDFIDPGTSIAVLDPSECAVRSKKDNPHLTKPSSQDGSQGHSGSSSLQQRRSCEGSREPNLPTESLREEAGPSRRIDNAEPGLSTANTRMDNDALLSEAKKVTEPSHQHEEPLTISGRLRSPSNNVRPARGQGASSIEAAKQSNDSPSKEKSGKSELDVQRGEISENSRRNISPRKNITVKNPQDAIADSRQPSNVTGETRDYKVHCCSKQLLQEVLGMCTGICKEIVDSQQYLNEEQKQQHHKNLNWDFETAFQENVSINGLSWHEAPDKDSEPDIKILEDQLDETMVETAMKRKRYPRKILTHFVKALKTEREILNQYKPVVNPGKIALDPAFELRMKDLSATTASVSQHIHETKKSLPVQLEKAEGFSQVLNLQPVLEGSRIRKDIFYSRVVIEDISKSTPKVLETTPTESESQDLATPMRNLRKRKVLPQRHLYPLQSKRKITLES
ncbi:kinetochore-associated protein NSL1 homolog [Pyxicephalus adspersus]|uniref:Uncharacterized protein n=1 Tax=Pyxicephalus adspersus TaxID=30357 RepID=A0AAV3AQD2_PYXAD|nr:TPA: hypothetical protein GDO54_011409 [Pyxicephalus adspersus]